MKRLALICALLFASCDEDKDQGGGVLIIKDGPAPEKVTGPRWAQQELLHDIAPVIYPHPIAMNWEVE